MSAKSNKIELSREFMAMLREDETLCDIMFLLYSDKNWKKQKFEKNVG